MSEKPVTKAIVLTDGEVIPESFMDRYRVTKDHPDSKQITDDIFSSAYAENGLVEPIYNPAMLAQLMDLSTYHARAVKTKAHDTAGMGWTLETVEGVDQPSELDKDRAWRLLTNCHPTLLLSEILDQCMVDYEATGNGYLELIRDRDGVIVGLEHLPAHTMRAHHDHQRYQQRRGNNVAWFAAYGTGVAVNYRTGEIISDGADPAERGTEVMHFKSYSPQSDYYGVPDIIPALGSVLGDHQRQEFNLSFFENHAIPAYAVTVSGAELDEETEARIRQFFMKDVKDNPHSTLVLSADRSPDATYNPDLPPIEFKFEKLATETREASFSVFREQNRDEILSAHGVPPYRAGVVIEGQLGGSSAGEATEIYKQSVIAPRQARLENRLTRALLHDGLGITEYRIKFSEIDTRDLDREIKRAEILFKMGVTTPNEIRLEQGMDASKEPGMDEHYINGIRVGETTTDERFDSMMASVKQLHAMLAARAGGRHE